MFIFSKLKLISNYGGESESEDEPKNKSPKLINTQSEILNVNISHFFYTIFVPNELFIFFISCNNYCFCQKNVDLNLVMIK